MIPYLRIAIGAALCAMAGTAASATIGDSGITENPLSHFEVTVDGQFTGGVSNGAIVGEWSDVTPQAFIAPSSNQGTLFRTDLGDPRANSLLYAAIAPGTSLPAEGLYLMYDYLGRTNPIFAAGEFIADVTFPVTLGAGAPALEAGGSQPITVQLRGNGNLGPSFFDIFVDLGGGEVVSAEQLGIEGAAGFGPSSLSDTSHLLVELEVPLLISPEFAALGNAFPPGGLNGIYSPLPAFWGANSAKDAGDPPISSAIFTIHPDGSTTVDASSTPVAPPVPEPASTALAGIGLASLLAVRRARKRATFPGAA